MENPTKLVVKLVAERLTLQNMMRDRNPDLAAAVMDFIKLRIVLPLDKEVSKLLTSCYGPDADFHRNGFAIGPGGLDWLINLLRPIFTFLLYAPASAARRHLVQSLDGISSNLGILLDTLRSKHQQSGWILLGFRQFLKAITLAETSSYFAVSIAVVVFSFYLLIFVLIFFQTANASDWNGLVISNVSIGDVTADGLDAALTASFGSATDHLKMTHNFMYGGKDGLGRLWKEIVYPILFDFKIKRQLDRLGAGNYYAVRRVLQIFLTNYALVVEEFSKVRIFFFNFVPAQLSLLLIFGTRASVMEKPSRKGQHLM